jgi:hypothetical protein
MMLDLGDLGFLVHAKKCIGVNDPLSSIRALGFSIDFTSQTYKCPSDKLKRIREGALRLLATRSVKLPVKRIAAVAGLIGSTTLAVGPTARIRTRALLRNLEARLRPGENPSSKASWRRHVMLSAEAVAELTWWSVNALLKFGDGMPIAHLHPVMICDAMLASDASATGWGGWVGIGSELISLSNAFIANLRAAAPKGVTVSEISRAARRGVEVAGSFSLEQASRSSSWRELYGVLGLILALTPLLRNARVRIQLDSSVATGALGGQVPNSTKFLGGSMKDDLQELVIKILDLCSALNLDLQAFWRPRAENARADSISHEFEFDQYDYTLRQGWVQFLENAWGPHDVNRFASGKHNCVVRSGRFNSRFGHGDKGWEWADSLTINWHGCVNWIHPPYMLIDRVLDHCIACRARGTLIVPDWPSASWWPRLFQGSRSNLTTAPREAIGVADSEVVSNVIWLGQADRVLFYPTKGSEFAWLHLPHGDILAVRFDYSCST